MFHKGDRVTHSVFPPFHGEVIGITNIPNSKNKRNLGVYSREQDRIYYDEEEYWEYDNTSNTSNNTNTDNMQFSHNGRGISISEDGQIFTDDDINNYQDNQQASIEDNSDIIDADFKYVDE